MIQSPFHCVPSTPKISFKSSVSNFHSIGCCDTPGQNVPGTPFRPNHQIGETDNKAGTPLRTPRTPFAQVPKFLGVLDFSQESNFCLINRQCLCQDTLPLRSTLKQKIDKTKSTSIASEKESVQDLQIVPEISWIDDIKASDLEEKLEVQKHLPNNNDHIEDIMLDSNNIWG